MILIGIASVLCSLAAMVFAVAYLFKVLGVKLPEEERELTEDEKRALAASVRASEKWEQAMDSLVFGTQYGGDGV